MCGCTSNINGMKRRKRIGAMSAKGLQGAVMDALPIAGGYLAAAVLDKQLTFLSNNPTTGAIVKIALGAIVASSGSGAMSGIGVGIAANGVTSFALPALQKGGIARLLPPGTPSALVAGVGEGFSVKVQ